MMARLIKEVEEYHGTWSTGSAEFYVEPESNFGKIIVGVQCRIGDAEETNVALLDTAATWSIIGGELAQDFNDLPIEVRDITLKSRFGDITGHLKVLNITLVANHGIDLTMESTVLISEDWPGPPVVLGFRGFLERLRIALDPGTGPESVPMLYFGQCE